MKKVLVNVEFKDRYTGEKYVAGKTYEMTDERIKEVKEVNPNFIDVIGTVETVGEDAAAADQGTGDAGTDDAATKEPAKKKASKKDAE